VVIGDQTQGAAQWSFAIGLSGLAIAILAPVLGAVADHAGNRKRWVFWFSMLCIVPTILLAFGQPVNTPGNVTFILVCVIIANIGFEMGQVFYNAMLPHVAPPGKIGRVSGWAWGMGYIGGLVALVITMFGLIGIGDMLPWFDVTGQNSMNVRASALLTAAWFAVFMIPLFIYTKDIERMPKPVGEAARDGVRQLVAVLRNARTHKNLLTFLVGSALYRDGLVTLFAVGGVYAAGQFGMDFQEILIFAIGLNVTAGLGAFAFAYLDDWLGSRPTVILSLFGLILAGLAILMVHDKHDFIVLAMVLGIFIGPVQAASRTLAGRLAPPGMVTQTYGLYALTGKSVSFLGPMAYAAAVTATGTQQAGMLTIVFFWLAGLILLSFVREK
jgi:MFS transporter, UMF1 family